MSEPSGGSTILHMSPVTTSLVLQNADPRRSSGGDITLTSVNLTYLGWQGQLHSPAGPSGPGDPVGPGTPMGPSGPGGPGGPSGPVSP
eukprot:CAMPEP_0198329206 /NCGR_PEP_ID=MMETSP1450-20131203/16023_1 /TAXON_ID=753684 ORGANISM="Madagascaria erythrocladiodes, Strain CCMP3234" /NCGR_SAMPLE_ID=MMETSP1450 /ASSEMBLY_ACC=CAM_ASM_001115 /LENGTH=87 /DNA_ID=CAMNT_0044033403 /DNA_START=754 /DNA_END=1017 /DNA_ORIENTATION=+